MKDKEKQFKERIDCGQATIIEEIEITEEAVRKNEDNAGVFVELLNQEQAELQKAMLEEMAIELIHSVGDWLHLWQAKSIVNILLVSGWIKPSENSVVLSREEYESDLTLQYDTGYEFGGKETAEKICEQLCGHGTTYVKKWIKEQFDIEIKG